MMNNFNKYKVSMLLLTGLFSIQFLLGQSREQITQPELVDLYNDWREFEVPPFIEGVPDYSTSAFEKREESFQTLRNRLQNMPKENWTDSEQVDWHLLWAEMNGYEFNTKILKSWEKYKFTLRRLFSFYPSQ